MRGDVNLLIGGNGNLHMQRDIIHKCEIKAIQICKEGGGKAESLDLPMKIVAQGAVLYTNLC